MTLNELIELLYRVQYESRDLKQETMAALVKVFEAAGPLMKLLPPPQPSNEES